METADAKPTELSPQGRLDRIAEQHAKNVDDRGGTHGECRECGWHWPCATYRWATESPLTTQCTWELSDCSSEGCDHAQA